MKKFFCIAFIAVFFIVTGCSEQKAKEIFDTAELEELQNSTDHAAALYEEIIRKYPDSSYAGKSRQRLELISQKEKKE